MTRTCLFILLYAGCLGAAFGQPAAKPASQDANPRLDLHGDPLPQGAIARLGTNRFRGALFKPHFLPDGKSFMTASREAFQFWEPATGRLLREIPVGNLHIHRIAISHDGKLAAAIGQGKRVWDISSGKEVQSFATDRKAPPDNIAFSRDNNFLISSVGGVVRIDDIVTGKEFKRRDFKASFLVNFALSPDGATLAVAGRQLGTKIFLWQWTGPDDPRAIKVPGEGPYVVSFSPDGKVLAFSDQMGDAVHLWDLGTDRLLHTINMKDKKLCCANLAFSPDGKTLAITDSGNSKNFSGGVYVIAMDDRRLLAEWPTPGVQVMWASFSPDGRWLAATTSGGVRVWEWPSGKLVADVDEAHRGTISTLAISGNLVISGSFDNTARVWDASTGKQKSKFEHGGGVCAAALSPDGAKLLTSSLDDSVRLWDLKTGAELKRLPGHGRYGSIRAVAFSSDGQRIHSWGDGRALRTWETSTGKMLSEHEVPPRSGPKVLQDGLDADLFHALYGDSGARFSADGKHLVFVHREHVQMFETATGLRSRMIPCPTGQANSLAVSADGRSVVASIGAGAAKSGAMVVWEVATGRLRKSFVVEDAGFSGRSIALSGDGVLVAASARTSPDKIHVYRLSKGEAVATYAGFPSKAGQLAFAQDNRYLVSALWDTSALVWAPRWQVEPAGERLSEETTRRLWNVLAGDDADKAYEAIDALARSPEGTVAFLRSHLRPQTPPEAGKIAEHIRDMNSDRFEVRDKARRELEAFSDFIEPEVKAALAKNPPLETARRLERLLAKRDEPLTASNALQEARALEVLERIAGGDARKLLETLVRGPTLARLTQDARETLVRLGGK